MRSLRNIAASGTKKASRLFANSAPPNKASAASGAKFGGCGISRESAASKTNPVSKRKRGLFIGSHWIPQSDSIYDSEFIRLEPESCNPSDGICISGAQFERPGLSAALSHLREADTLVVSKLDRLERSVWWTW